MSQIAVIALDISGPIANPNDAAVAKRPIANGKISGLMFAVRMADPIENEPPHKPVTVRLTISHVKDREKPVRI
jgi:hypothetical protein